MAESAQSILDTIASIEEAIPAQEDKHKARQKELLANTPGRIDTAGIPGVPGLADIMRDTLNHPKMLELASHPDFPALAQDSGVQSLVSALTNQVGKVLQGIKGSGQNTYTTLGD
jgi:hypothetical protein